jgi:hypothetical protein
MSSAPAVCRDFLRGKCTRSHCRFAHTHAASETTAHIPTHPPARREHPSRPRPHRKNTESFEPLDRPVDMRIVCDTGSERLSLVLTSRDVLLVPNLFHDFAPGELYNRLTHEILHCGVPHDRLLKSWHGDTHLIADDHTEWKKNAPTFVMVVDRIRQFFDMDIQATRFNWYRDTSQWKPFHHDAAAIKPKQAATQNFTVAVSFGATRDAAFEEVKSKTVISMPQPDGCAYCFAKDTNILWKHGILQEIDARAEGRISIICWGWVNNQI